MNFAPFNAQTTSLFKNCNIVKFADIINVESCIFINNYFSKDPFKTFNVKFKLVSTTHKTLDQSEMVFYFYQVIILNENKYD